MTLEYLHLLANASYILNSTQGNYNFVDCNTKFYFSENLENSINYNEGYFINIYRKEGIIFWINNIDKTYYSFKLTHSPKINPEPVIKDKVIHFLHDAEPYEKNLDLEGYEYKSFQKFIAKYVLKLLI